MPRFQRSGRSTGIISRASAEVLESRWLMAFGLTTTSSSYTVDTGAQLVFSVARTTAAGGSVGDLTSMLYSGTQLEAPFSVTDRYSHYESGLSSTTAVSATVDPQGNWIEITCNDLSGVGVVQYYIAYKGLNNIYMATYAPGPNSPSPGEMRFITYTNHSVLTNAPAPSNLTGNTGAIESSDVFGFADGTTASKYYGETEIINDAYHGLTGGGIRHLHEHGQPRNEFRRAVHERYRFPNHKLAIDGALQLHVFGPFPDGELPTGIAGAVRAAVHNRGQSGAARLFIHRRPESPGLGSSIGARNAFRQCQRDAERRCCDCRTQQCRRAVLGSARSGDGELHGQRHQARNVYRNPLSK